MGATLGADSSSSSRTPPTRVGGMPGPVLLAVDDDPDALREVESGLLGRYSRDFTVLTERACAGGRRTLEKLAGEGQEVALVLAPQWLSGMTGSELLGRVHQIRPHAKRGLLIEWAAWGDRPTGEAIFDAVAHGRIDYYVLRPSVAPGDAL